MSPSDPHRAPRLGLAIGVLAVIALQAPAGETPAVGSERTQRGHPVAMTGHDWGRLSPAARDAYLAGFLAGAAAQQAAPAGGTSGAEVARRAAALRQRGALAFAFRENVYRSHLDDYFFYENRRGQTLIEVLVDLTASARRPR